MVPLAALCMTSVLSLSGCVDQHAGGTADGKAEMQTEGEQIQESEAGGTGFGAQDDGSVESMLEITDPVEQEAVAAAKAKVKSLGRQPNIIATSPATVAICERLDLDLAGVSSSTLFEIPKRYKDVPEVGLAMSPDMEIIDSLHPDWILSPASLQSDLQPKYEEISTDWAFLNLKSVPGMYRSMQELGDIFGKEKEAGELVREFTRYYNEYKKKNAGQEGPSVLLLMGLPGSYVIATENSYAGSLVEMAGGKNVYAGTDKEFLNVNTEDMKTKEPDIILRTAHAMPDKVMTMFQEDFRTNDVWKHFRAVQEGRVYDLTTTYFGMSATFNYPYALEELQDIFYGENTKETGEAAADGE